MSAYIGKKHHPVFLYPRQLRRVGKKKPAAEEIAEEGEELQEDHDAEEDDEDEEDGMSHVMLQRLFWPAPRR